MVNVKISVDLIDVNKRIVDFKKDVGLVFNVKNFLVDINVVNYILDRNNLVKVIFKEIYNTNYN